MKVALKKDHCSFGACIEYQKTILSEILYIVKNSFSSTPSSVAIYSTLHVYSEIGKSLG